MDMLQQDNFERTNMQARSVMEDGGREQKDEDEDEQEWKTGDSRILGVRAVQ